MMMRFTFLTVVSSLCLLTQGQMNWTDRWPDPLMLADGIESEVGPSGMNVAEKYTEANRLIIEENWEEAEILMASLMADDPTNRNFAFKRALCLRALPGRLAEAVPLVHMAVDGPFANRYNAFAIDEVLPPEEALELGLEVLQNAYHFAEAQALAEVIIERFPHRDYRHARALEVIEECAFAIDCVRKPLNVSIASVDALNSAKADYAPVVTPDGETLYFTSHRGRQDERDNGEGRIYRSMKVDGHWSKPVRLDVGTPGRDVTTVGIIGDEEGLLAYQSYRNEGSVWKLSQDEVGGWTKEEKLGFPIDSRHWETSMTERFDGWERIFVSNRPGGQGGRDLYRTVKLPDGTWSEPLNLGRRINSVGEEESPVLSSDGQTLIFASTGHPGMGGFDLFRCRRLDNGSWSDPEHLGHPLNTPGNEAVLTLDASGSAGYISSTRGGGDDLNIYRVEFREDPGEELAVMIGEVLAWQDGDVMEVRSVDGGSAIFRVFRARKETGKFLAALPPCRDYAFSWVRRGETLLKRKVTVGCDAAYGAAEEVLRLAPFRWDVDPDVPAIESAPDVSAEEEIAASGSGMEEPAEVLGGITTQRANMDAPVIMDAKEEVAAPSHSFADDTDAGTPNSEADSFADEVGNNIAEAADGAAVDSTYVEVPAVEAATPIVMMEFAAVTEQIEFGYGKYLTQSGSREVVSMALSIMERNMAGEVPVLQIEGSASFVPVKNKRAYETNEQLAKMRAQKARDAMITELAMRGLQVGVDYQIVLDWGVAGPEYKGDAIKAASEYRNYQYAKFSLSRTMVEKRG